MGKNVIIFGVDMSSSSSEIPSMIIVVRVVFHENDKYYPQTFLDECPYKLWII